MTRLRGKVAAVGVGYSKIERQSTRSLLALTCDAIVNALSDAGIPLSSVDGLTTFPELPVFDGGHVDGRDIVSNLYLARALGIERQLRWHAQSDNLIPNAFIEAVNAVAAGASDCAVVFRAMRNPGGRYNAYTSSVATGTRQFTIPYGFHRGYQSFGAGYRRYMNAYGATREHMATFILNNRDNAQLNENAFFKGARLTEEDYLNSRMLADPVCLLDCDIPIDGAAAIVLTTTERARDLSRRPAYIAGFGQVNRHWTGPSPTLEFLMESGRSAAELIWKSSGVRPADVDVAQLYDGYSFFTYWWLEACGFCKEGEAFEFIQNRTISLNGNLPLNTFGGQLGEGRMHGMGHIAEAVRQAAGRAGPRQVRNTKVSLAVVGPPVHGGAGILFTSEPI